MHLRSKIEKPARPGAPGYVFALVLVIMALVLAIAGALLATRQQWRAVSAKVLQQRLADHLLQNNLIQERVYITENLRTNLSVTPATLANPGAIVYNTNAQYTTSIASINSSSATIALNQSQSSLITSVNNIFDPYEGAFVRSIDTITITNRATRLGADSYSLWRNRWQSAVFSIRQMPVSLFTFFGGGLSSIPFRVDETISASGVRIHSQGAMVIGGQVFSTHPVTVGGTLTFSGGGSLSLNNPHGPNPPVMNQANQIGFHPFDPSVSAAWRAKRQSIYKSRVLTTFDVPVSLAQPASLVELTGVGSGQSLPCESTLSFSGPPSSYVAAWTTPSGTTFFTNSAPPGFSYTRPPGEELTIGFNYTALTPLLFSYRLITDQPDNTPTKRHRVLVSNAQSLAADLSIVTPYQIHIQGSFNSVSPVRAASLITADRLYALPP